MKVTSEKLEKNMVCLTIEVGPEKLDEGMDKAYSKLVKKVTVPGFRKGKAPRSFLIKHVGKEHFLAEAFDTFATDVYGDAVKEAQLDVIDQANLEVVQLEEGKPVIFKANVPVKPEVVLGEYKGLKIKKVDAVVAEDAVDKELNILQSRHAKMVILDEGSVGENDVAMLDFEGFFANEKIPGGEAYNYPVEIGSHTFIPGFEEQLLGMEIGTEKEINIVFPDNYEVANLAGKPARFNVKLKEIQRKEMVPLDDEFAKDVSEFETLDELKESLQKELQAQAEVDARRKMEDELIKKIVADSEVEIPEVMVADRAQEMFDNLIYRMGKQGISMESYLRYSRKTEKQAKDEMIPEARKSVEEDLVLDSITKHEAIVPDEEEIQAEVVQMAAEYKQKPEDLWKNLHENNGMKYVRHSAARKKTMRFLMDNAVLD